MTLLLILKSAIVVLFLLMFLRRPSVSWAIGLLTATSAVLLDTFLGTFGREEMLAELGFFFYVISGALFGGAASWIFNILQPLVTPAAQFAPSTRAFSGGTPPVDSPGDHPNPETQGDEEPTPLDRQMLFDEIRQRFGREDTLDLIFDLGINENDVVTFHQEMDQLILNVMEIAIQHDQAGALSLAVERILTPPPPEYLPRLEKISVDSPPTILRHYLLSHYDLSWLERTATDLGIDWEQLSGGSKKGRVRNLLLYLYRRNRIGELIEYMQEEGPNAAGNEGIPG